MIQKLFALSATVLCLAACQSEPSPLVGSWRAVNVREAGDSLALDPTEISFRFRANQRYDYASTLAYREAGTWRYANGFLYAKDTTGASNQEYVVAVGLLRNDSLQLRMNAAAGVREVLLLRE